MANIEFHPLADIFPLLHGERFDSLVDSIRQNDLIDPITLYEDQIIDGRNRYRACQAAGVEPRFVQMEWTGLVADFVWARGERREQSPGERVISAGRYSIAREGEAKCRQLAGLKNSSSVQICTDEDFGRSREVAAEKFDVSERTVSSAVKVLKEGAPELIAAVESGAIKVSAAAEIASLPKEEQAAVVEKSPDERVKAANKIKSRRKAKKQDERKAKIVEMAALVEPSSSRHSLYLEPCSAILDHAPESADWIITDPPYPKEFLSVYDDLGAAAAHALKPGGSLLCMIGQSYLPDIVAALGKHLTYHWTLAYLTPGGQAVQIFPRSVNTFWKPVLWFVKGEFSGNWIGDSVASKTNDNDKRFHEWGQSESGMRDIMARFVKPGEVVIDPFMGGGTTGVVALSLGAKFFGFDINEQAFNEATVRMDRASLVA